MKKAVFVAGKGSDRNLGDADRNLGDGNRNLGDGISRAHCRAAVRAGGDSG